MGDTRKTLKTQYGYTYTSGLTTLFDIRKMLLMMQSKKQSYVLSLNKISNSPKRYKKF